MKQKGILILALVLGVAAILLVQVYVRKVEQRYEVGEKVTILVAAKEIPAGIALDATHLKELTIPKKFYNPNSLQPKDLDLVLGQITNNALRPEQPILWSDIGVTTTSALGSIVQEGERAVTIPVDEVTGVAGLLKPDDHIDIIGTFTVPSEINMDISDLKKMQYSTSYQVKTTTITLLQNVTILAAGETLGTRGVTPEMEAAMSDGGMGGLPFGGGGGGGPAGPTLRIPKNIEPYTTLTLLVTPLEAEILVYAMEKGKLTCALRNSDDLLTQEKLPTITFTDIVTPEFRQEVQVERTKREKKKALEIVRGKPTKR